LVNTGLLNLKKYAKLFFMRGILTLFLILSVLGCNKLSDEEEWQRYYNDPARKKQRSERYLQKEKETPAEQVRLDSNYEPLLNINKQAPIDFTANLPKTNTATPNPRTSLPKPNLATPSTTITTNLPKTSLPLSPTSLDKRRRQDF